MPPEVAAPKAAHVGVDAHFTKFIPKFTRPEIEPKFHEIYQEFVEIYLCLLISLNFT